MIFAGFIIWILLVLWMGLRHTDSGYTLAVLLTGSIGFLASGLIALLMYDFPIFCITILALTLCTVLIWRSFIRMRAQEASFLRKNPVFVSHPIGFVLGPNGLGRELFMTEADDGFRIGIRFEVFGIDDARNWQRTEWDEVFATYSQAGGSLITRLHRDFMQQSSDATDALHLDWQAELKAAASKLVLREELQHQSTQRNRNN